MKTILATTEAGLRPSLRARYLFSERSNLIGPHDPLAFDSFKERSNPILVQIFEELKEKASHTPFIILDTPDDFNAPYLDTEEGLELIRESHRTLRPVYGTPQPELATK
jgi:hypothetical protein